MVRLTKLNGVEFLLNSDLIEHLEETPDTVITLITGQAVRVRESLEQVRRKIIEFRQTVGSNPRTEVISAVLKRSEPTHGELSESARRP